MHCDPQLMEVKNPDIPQSAGHIIGAFLAGAFTNRIPLQYLYPSKMVGYRLLARIQAAYRPGVCLAGSDNVNSDNHSRSFKQILAAGNGKWNRKHQELNVFHTCLLPYSSCPSMRFEHPKVDQLRSTKPSRMGLSALTFPRAHNISIDITGHTPAAQGPDSLVTAGLPKFRAWSVVRVPDTTLDAPRSAANTKQITGEGL